MKKTKVLSVLALTLVIGGITNFVSKSLVAIDPPDHKPLNVIVCKTVAIDPPDHIMIDPPDHKPSI